MIEARIIDGHPEHRHGSRGWHWVWSNHREGPHEEDVKTPRWVGSVDRDMYERALAGEAFAHNNKKGESIGKRTTTRESAGLDSANVSSKYKLERVK